MLDHVYLFSRSTLYDTESEINHGKNSVLSLNSGRCHERSVLTEADTWMYMFQYSSSS